jgi:hypothetical protein
MRQEDKSLDGSGDLFEPGELKDRDEVSKLGVGKASRVRIKAASGGESSLACSVVMDSDNSVNTAGCWKGRLSEKQGCIRRLVTGA